MCFQYQFLRCTNRDNILSQKYPTWCVMDESRVMDEAELRFRKLSQHRLGPDPGPYIPAFNKTSVKWLYSEFLILRFSNRCRWLSGDFDILLLPEGSLSKTYSGKCGRYVKHKRVMLNIHCTFFPVQVKFRGHNPEVKLFPRFISNSGKRRKVRKNSFAKIRGNLKNFSELAFFDFVFTE